MPYLFSKNSDQKYSKNPVLPGMVFGLNYLKINIMIG
jgi:hypothetical protein